MRNNDFSYVVLPEISYMKWSNLKHAHHYSQLNHKCGSTRGSLLLFLRYSYWCFIPNVVRLPIGTIRRQALCSKAREASRRML